MKWLPETLALLLHLADDPVNRTRIESLGALERPAAPGTLTWAEILQEDPLDNCRGTWNDVDFGAESSSFTESLDEDESLSLKSSEASFLSADDGHATLVDNVDPDSKALDEVLATCRIRVSDFSEARMVRETLYMLQGLPSLLYESKPEGPIKPMSGLELRQLSKESLYSALDSFASIGTSLHHVRDLLHREERLPLHQALQASWSATLQALQSKLLALEQQCLKDAGDSSTLITLSYRVEDASRAFIRLSREIEPALLNSTSSRETLELLYNRVCSTQSQGDIEGYKADLRMFLDCLLPYLKPIQRWMLSGEIDFVDPAFLIQPNELRNGQKEVSWNAVSLRHEGDGEICAPSFIRFAASRILATGKSICLIQSLGSKSDGIKIESVQDLTFESLYGLQGHRMLQPFVAIFRDAFGNWVSQFTQRSSSISRVLSSECGLMASLETIQCIFLGRNGACFSLAASRIFERIDRGKHHWSDAFAVTKIFRGAFSDVRNCEPSRVSVTEGCIATNNLAAGSMRSLERIKINYALPRVVNSIINPRSMKVLQNVSIMLLQIQKARQALIRLTLKFNRSRAENEQVQYRAMLSLRQQLSSFLDAWQCYLSLVVFPSISSDLEKAAGSSLDVDCLVDGVNGAIGRLGHRCLLADSQALAHEALVSIMELTVLLSDIYGIHNGADSYDGESTSDDDRSRPIRESTAQNRSAHDHDTSELRKRLRKYLRVLIDETKRTGGEDAVAVFEPLTYTQSLL